MTGTLGIKADFLTGKHKQNLRDRVGKAAKVKEIVK
jgi:hypothetical protein